LNQEQTPATQTSPWNFLLNPTEHLPESVIYVQRKRGRPKKFNAGTKCIHKMDDGKPVFAKALSSQQKSLLLLQYKKLVFEDLKSLREMINALSEQFNISYAQVHEIVSR
jgi:hypothetical protein